MPDADDQPAADSYDLDARDEGDLVAFADATAVGFGWFRGLLTNALAHASTAGRADPQAATHPWIPRGPRNVGGRVRAMVQDPETPRRIWAGAAFGGLWRTENSGETWSSVEVDGQASLPFGAIGICHTKPDHIYLGTGEPVTNKYSGNGLYYSDDGGSRFTQLTMPAGVSVPERCETIVVDPWDEHLCWIATPIGLFSRTGASLSLTRIDINGTGAPPLGEQDVTDIAIDFGNRDLAALPRDQIYTIYVGVRTRRKNSTPGHADFDQLHVSGLYRTTYNPATAAYSAWEQLWHRGFPFPVEPDDIDLSSTNTDTIRTADYRLRQVQRIKISICEKHPETVYMVAGLGDHKASTVFRSDDRGTTWRSTGDRDGDDGTQAYYDLFVAAHPDDPDICIMGSVEVWRTLDGGESWTHIVSHDNFRRGDRAQHADQHFLFYDRRDPRRIWLCNDHGISESRNLGDSWRLRSFGIQATQFYDLTTHPTYPWMFAGGFQDNGSWVSYGGTTWFFCGIADGGAVGFLPGNTNVFLSSTQGNVSRTRIELAYENSLRPTTLGEVSNVNLIHWRYRLGNRLADYPTRDEAGVTQYPYAIGLVQRIGGGVNGFGRDAIFGRKLAGHPTTPRFIAGDRGEIYVSTGGDLTNDPPDLDWDAQEDDSTDVPDFTAAVTAIALGGGAAADTDWWIGTEDGEIFFTDNGGTNWHDVTARVQAGLTGGVTLAMISDIQVHPQNRDIVIVTRGRQSQNVLISGDARSRSGGTPDSTWRTISHTSTTLFGGPGSELRLPNSPVTRAAFDGDPALASGITDPLTVYVATLVGVYVSRNVVATGAANPDWRAFNNGMPLVLLRDIEYVQSLNADGTVRRKALRAGTYGRGVYECDITAAGAPEARLMIRTTAIDDSHDYIAAETVTHDPRLTLPDGTTTAPDLTRSVDIRIDPPPYEQFGDVLDAVEFDEDLRSGPLVLGETNFIYVQVHTRGHATLANVEVHLYFADAPGNPPIAPDLNPTFWTNFPNAQPGAANWQKVDDEPVSELHSGQPRVVRIEWTPPTSLGANVALLAIATHAQDSLVGLAGPDQPTRSVHPTPAILPNAIGVAERRAALYIVPTRTTAPDVFIRDALDDTGEPGAVAWGGRGADILVTPSPVGDPETEFADITDLRPDDRIRGGQDNFVYVRGFNGAKTEQTVQVDVYAVPFATLADARTWVQVGTRRQLIDLAPGAREITFPITWEAADIADPAPGSSHKTILLIALVGSDGDPMPDHTGIRTLSQFWEFFRSAERANNASFRALIYEEP